MSFEDYIVVNDTENKLDKEIIVKRRLEDKEREVTL